MLHNNNCYNYYTYGIRSLALNLRQNGFLISLITNGLSRNLDPSILYLFNTLIYQLIIVFSETCTASQNQYKFRNLAIKREKHGVKMWTRKKIDTREFHFLPLYMSLRATALTIDYCRFSFGCKRNKHNTFTTKCPYHHNHKHIFYSHSIENLIKEVI